MAQWDQWCLGSPEMQVRYPALHSGLKIWHCCSCSLGYDCSWDMIPGPRNYICHRAAKKGKKKKTKLNKLNILKIKDT